MSLIYLKDVIDSDERIIEESDDKEVEFVESDYLDFESDVSSQKPDYAVKKGKTLESAGNLQSQTNLENEEIRSEFIPKDEEL